MGYLTEKQTIMEAFIEGWTNTIISGPEDAPVEEKVLETPVDLENRPLDTKKLTEYVRFSIKNADSDQIALSCDHGTRYFGLVSLIIFVRPSTGENRSLELADRFNSIFRQRRVKNIVFRTPDLNKMGVIEEWYQVNVSIPFSRTE